MTAPLAASRTRHARRTGVRRAGGAILLAGVSMLALLAAATPAVARNLFGPAGGNVSASASAQAAAAAAARQAAAMAQQSMQSLTKATQALQALQAAQAAARNAAAASAVASTVADGLSAGGLIVDPRVAIDATLWKNISAPTQTQSGSQTVVTLTQTSQRAIATWQQFNVGANTTVHFDQSAGNSANGNAWTVLNRVDAGGVPSRILGQIQADGTVLLINPNGIVFTGSSQINVHTLIAAAMDLNSLTGTANGAFKTNADSSGTPNLSASAYVPVLVNGVAQTTSAGTALLAPSDEANANKTFLNGGLFVNAPMNAGTSLVTGNSALFSAGLMPGQGNIGVRVEAGAKISTNVSGFDNGGFVALLGPQVVNAGTIATSAGQIVLAAGSSVQIGQPAANTTQTLFAVQAGATIASNLLYTPPVVSGGARAVNDVGAILLSRRGNITLSGDAVEQRGLAEATTSITRAGSITVVANGATSSNQVLFGPQSLTTILPEENGESIPSDPASLANFTRPRIDVAAPYVDFQSGSWVLAPSAIMAVTGPGQTSPDGSALPPVGRVVLVSGSVIDLSGLTATRSVADYLYTFKVTANDVADTPLARTLIGKTVTIDLTQTGTRADGESWVGSPLFASSGAGYLANVTQGIDQLLTKGGSLTFGSGTAVTNGQGTTGFVDALQVAGSKINLSGGLLQFTGAQVATTQLIGADGRRYDIAGANPFIANTIASAFTVAHPHWGVTETYGNPLLTGSFEKVGYVDGISAGSLSVTAVNPVIEGDLTGDIVIGIRQRALAQPGTGTGGAQTTPDQLPQGAALSLSLLATGISPGDLHDAVVLRASAPTVLAPDFSITSTLALPTATSATSAGRSTAVIGYSTDRLTSFGLGSLIINGADTLSIAAGASLSVLDGGVIKLGSVGTVDGSLIAHGGSITLAGPQAAVGTTALPNLAIGAGARLDVSGRWVNDAAAATNGFTGALAINGGSVVLSTYNLSSKDGTADFSPSIVLAAGSVIDVSSGGYVGPDGKIAVGSDSLPKGKGGDLSLSTYAGTWLDPNALGDGPRSSVPIYAPPAATNANVFMNGTIYAAGLSQGGTFSLQVPEVVVDGQAARMASVTSGAQAGTVVLPTSFFADSGFGAFRLTSTYGSITVTAATILTLKQQSYRVAPSASLPPTGARVRDFAALGYLPDGLRHAVDLALAQNTYPFGVAGDRSAAARLLIDAGARIVADPRANVTLSASGPAIVLGGISAPAGSISVTANNYVWIGGSAVLDVSGAFLPNPLITAYSTGSALPGGAISLSSGDTVIALSGSVLDISGASGTVDVPVRANALAHFGKQSVWSNAGSLTLGDGSGLTAGNVYFSGTIRAAGGAAGAAGGTLNISNRSGILISQSDDPAAFASNAAPATSQDLAQLLTKAPGVQVLTSTTSNAPVSTGSLTFTIATQLPANLMRVGGFVTISTLDGSGQTITMVGTISSYVASTGALTVGIATSYGPVGSTSYANWTVSVAPPRTSSIAANVINSANSGLDTLALSGPLYFAGNVGLKVAGSLLIDNLGFATTLLPQGAVNTAVGAAPCTPPAGCIPTIGGTTVTLEAGYIRLTNGYNETNTPLPALADGTLTLNARQGIDLVGVPVVNSAGSVNLVTGGDVRLTGSYNFGIYASTGVYASDGYGGAPFVGALLVADDLNVTAREVYPTTGSTYLLMSLSRAPSGASGTHNTIAFASNGAPPTAPLSAGGAFLVDAGTILQGGVLVAPLGTIQLGFGPGQTLPGVFINGTPNDPYAPLQTDGLSGLFRTRIATVATDHVTLAPGSLTSVSAGGLAIPYGATTDGTNWTFNNIGLNGPPTKLIVLGGNSIDARAGAVIDGSGGGDVYATEFVPGTGGSRNVLTTSAQTVYALLPGYGSALAPIDPTFTTAVTAGATVSLAGGNGVPAGTYALLPAQYATVPGAYRVVVVSTNTAAPATSSVAPDGSVFMTGILGNAINGSRSSQTILLQVQPNATWTRYSEIDINKGNAYFAALAAANGVAAPRLGADAARIVVAAGISLALNASNRFTPADGGLGGQLDITGTNLVVAAADQLPSFGTTANGVFTPDAAHAGYLFLDPDMLSSVGIESTLIGGYRGTAKQGTQITATAANVEVATDAAHPLTGPELLFTALAPTAANAAARGVVVDAGSVIAARGRVAGASSAALVFGADPVAQFDNSGNVTGYTAGVSGDGALLRVSNGGLVDVVRHFVPGVYQAPATTPTATGPVSTVALGNLAIGAGATLSANTLTLDSSGTSTVPVSANLAARNYDLSGSIINLGGGSGGLIASAALIGNFAGADVVRLRSASVFNLYGSNSFGSASNPIGAFTLDGAGLYSDGGATSIAAANVVLTNSQTAANTAGANTGGAGGSLTLVAADTLTFGAGAKTLNGFANIAGSAAGKVLFAGSGGVDAKSAAVSLTAPLFLVAAAASQSFVSGGPVTLIQGGTVPALDPTGIGGALSLKGGSIDVTGTIAALGGTLTLEATSGNLSLSGNALVTAAGTRISIGDLVQDTPAGTIRLYADTGNVMLGANSMVDVSAAGSGYAGTLSIFAGGTARLGGALNGGARYSDIGGELALIAGTFAGALPLDAGFTRSFAVSVGQGDISVGTGQTLKSENVLLVANAGNIFVDGTIDASAASGGRIGLYGAGHSTAAAGAAGASGVTIGPNARLIARYQAPDVNSPGYGNGESTQVQRGGTITLGTTGTPDGTLNATYGYQSVPGSGAITVAAGAVLDVSGGSGGANIDNTGGSVNIRAPILSNGSLNVTFNGTVVTNAKADGSASGSPLVANAFAVWSTTDAATDPNKHFDGIIDPAGFFDATGTRIISADANGLYPSSTASSPAAGAYLPHVNFYQTTLLSFVNNPFDMNAVAASFAGARLQVGANAAVAASPSALHLRPEIDLVNPSPATGPTSVNSGNITVASNWNFGAGSMDPSGNITLLYRTTNGGEPGTLALRAANNVQINATVSDGFFASYAALGDAATQYSQELNSALYQNYLAMLSNGVPQYNSSAINAYLSLVGKSWSSLGLTAPALTAPASAAFFNLTPSAFGALRFQLQAPNVVAGPANVIDQYNQYYAEYLTLFRAYETEIIAMNSSARIGFASGTSATGGGLLSYSDFINYVAKLRGLPTTSTSLINPLTSNFVSLAPPAAPTASNAYYNIANGLSTITFNFAKGYATTTAADYATKWTAYFYNIVNANLYDTGYTLATALRTKYGNGTTPTLTNAAGLDAWRGVYAALAATAPQAPPAYTTLQTGYASYGNVAPHDRIASNPGKFTSAAGVITVYNSTSSADLMSAVVSGKGSFSYDIVGGALFNADGTSSVNPNAVMPLSLLPPAVTGSVTLDKHTSYTDPLNGLTVYVPTMVRTGTGSITMTVANDFALRDGVAPGAVYTAGHVADNAPGFTAPTLPANAVNSGVLTNPVWATGGGNLIVTAGHDIIGIETPTDPGNAYSTNGSSKGVSSGQFWSQWYYVNGNSTGSPTAPFNPSAGGVQYSSWINYGTFFQGFGALGGGNVVLKAGRNVKDVSASLPETIQVSGGQSSSGPAATAHDYGGGNLLVEAGNDVLSGTYYVGRGTGLIRAGGKMVSDATLYETWYTSSTVSTTDPHGLKDPFSVPLLLAVQDGYVNAQAAGAIELGGIYQPTRLRFDLTWNLKTNTSSQAGAANTLPSAIGAYFDSYGANSGVTLASQSGSVTVNSLHISPSTAQGNTDTLFAHTRAYAGWSVDSAGPSVMPPNFSVTALSGNIQLANGFPEDSFLLYPSSTGQLSLIAGGSIIGAATKGSVTFGASYTLADYASASGVLAPMLGSQPAAPTKPLHAGDDKPVLVYAGADIDWGVYNLTKPARLWAGRDILNLAFTGQNNAPGDITSIVAGRDILARLPPDVLGQASTSTVSTFSLYGPGDFVIEAGRNIGPFFAVNPGFAARNPFVGAGGIFAIGDGSGSSPTPKLYLPTQGADITLRYGVESGIDYGAAIARYGDAATAAASGMDFVSGLVPRIAQVVDQLIVDRATAAGIASPSVHVTLSAAEAADLFTALPTLAINDKLAALAAKAGLGGLTFNLRPQQYVSLLQQQEAMKLAIDRGFLALLARVGIDYKDPSSPYAGKYARAYQAISTLFPASLGYTDNSGGGTGATPVRTQTGDLRMARSLVETQTGGNIDILGPGGNLIVGSNSADSLAPAAEGILTLAGGSVRTYTDGSALIYQSRIFTEQGGNVEMFSANGDLNAGKGPKSSAAYPPLRVICDADGYCRVNPSGLVTGAGIGALLSIPGQDPAQSNVVLTAPHGVIDAGAAGIRVAGNATFNALQILNAFNIDVKGISVGLPTVQGPPVGALTAANNAAGAVARSAEVPTGDRGADNQPSIIIVEVLGYGGQGGDAEPAETPRNDKPRGSDNGQSYDRNSAFKLLGNGALTQEQQNHLSDQERAKLWQLEQSHAL